MEDAMESGERERRETEDVDVPSDTYRTSDIGMASHFAMIDSSKESSICWKHWPDEPWNLQWYFSVRGQESLHVYLWIMKDLSWVQAWYYSGHFFGILSISFMLYIFAQAIRKKSLDEIWTTVAHILWLVANYVWMTGELNDTQYPDRKSMYDDRAAECGYIMMAAFVWISVYYVLLKPLRLMNEATAKGEEYDTTGLKCRFSWFFKTWREYENFHILLWIGKDLAWNQSIAPMWIIFFTPTVLCSIDFLWVSLNAPDLLVDHAHYVALSIWVVANSVWAIANIWYPDYDRAFDLGDVNDESLKTGRWFSSWVLVLSLVPIVLLHIVWIYGTAHNKCVDITAQRKFTDATEMVSTTTISPFAKEQEVKVTEPDAASY